MKRVISILLVLAMLCAALVGCGSKGGDSEGKAVTSTESAAGKYELTELTGLEEYGVTVDVYEYNYIVLNADGTYHLENKANDMTVEQNGKYTIDENGSIVFSESDGTYDYLLLEGEKVSLRGDTLTISASDENSSLRMVFQR